MQEIHTFLTKIRTNQSEARHHLNRINYEYLGHNVTFPLEEMRESTFCRTPGGFRGKCFFTFLENIRNLDVWNIFWKYFELCLLSKYSPSSLTRVEFWVSGKRKHWYWHWHWHWHWQCHDIQLGTVLWSIVSDSILSQYQVNIYWYWY